MFVIVTLDEAANALRQPDLVDDETFRELVDDVNAAALEAWAWQRSPAPSRVKRIVVDAIARGWTHVPGQRRLESLTRANDDASRTERYAETSVDAMAVGSFFTEAELAFLSYRRDGGPVRTIGVALSW